MPCRDYGYEEEQARTRKERCDMLARIACKALTELEKQGTAEFLLITDQEVREWWIQHKIDDAKAQAEK